MGVDLDEELIDAVDQQLLNQSQQEREGHAPRDNDEDAKQGELIRDLIAATLSSNYVTN